MTTKDKDNLRRKLRTMRYRCTNPNCQMYKYYGAKGIKVCDEWKDSNAFLLWAVKTGYKPGMTIDRIDSNGDYSPDNCRWATPRTQSNNRNSNEVVDYQGKRVTIAQLAELAGIPYGTALMRHRRGWSSERIVSQKLRVYAITDRDEFSANRKKVAVSKWEAGDYSKRSLPQNRK